VGDLWLRPALAPRDRSLVIVSALVVSGQSGQIPYHLNGEMDNGLTRAQASEVLTHLSFYAGWPNPASPSSLFQGQPLRWLAFFSSLTRPAPLGSGELRLLSSTPTV
jgi:hypothetical protein